MLKPSIVEFAKDYARYYHQGQTRRNGDDYVCHPLRVAAYVAEYKNSYNMNVLLCAAILHDILEDTVVTYLQLLADFGLEVASLVKEVTTNEDMKEAIGKKGYLGFKLKDMTSWALIIKLCDRLDNMRDMSDVTNKFLRRYVNETVYIIEYIERYRELTSTHIAIIKDIRCELEKYTIV